MADAGNFQENTDNKIEWAFDRIRQVEAKIDKLAELINKRDIELLTLQQDMLKAMKKGFDLDGK